MFNNKLDKRIKMTTKSKEIKKLTPNFDYFVNLNPCIGCYELETWQPNQN
jgi:hypothetical protein